MINRSFWKNKKVFITGHTGFKGSWLTLWLYALGADVTGYALHPPTCPNLFELCRMDSLVSTYYADIRDKEQLSAAIHQTNPDIVIHMAAQPLVRASYLRPVETYEINVMGTIHLLDAIRELIFHKKNSKIKAILNVTTDKCYENKEWPWGYRENDVLGGLDPYSNSKACSEMVTSAYVHSFFNPNEYAQHGVAIATARAGNVIGGGDWAEDRLVPDFIRTILSKGTISIRYPYAIRPWQHVLDPLSGYLLLIQHLYEKGADYAGGWNFGPNNDQVRSVEWMAQTICKKWGDQVSYEIDQGKHPHEAQFLKLDCSKAQAQLGWYPKWNVEQAIDKIIEWTKAYQTNQNVRMIGFKQIMEYEKLSHKKM